MSDLNDFLRELSLARAQKKVQQEASVEHLGDFLSVVAEAKAQDPKHQMLREVKGRLQEDIVGLFSQLEREKHGEQPPVPQPIEVPPESPAEPIVEEQQIPAPEVVLTEVVTTEVKPASQIHSQDEIDKYLRTNATFQQPNPDMVDPNIRAIQDKLKFMEQWIGKIAATGPGGGAGEIYNLDMPTKVVTGDYTIDRKDYYIGVNANVKTTITLPTSGRNVKNGRVLVIKDESGHAQLTPIKVVGTVDNDPNGFEIRINNGAVQLIYRDGWRII